MEERTTNLYMLASGGKFPQHLVMTAAAAAANVRYQIWYVGSTHTCLQHLAMVAMDACGRHCDAFYIMSTGFFSSSGGNHPWKEERLSEMTSLVCLKALEESGS